MGGWARTGYLTGCEVFHGAAEVRRTRLSDSAGMLYLLTKRMRCFGRKTYERERQVGEQKNKRAEGWRLSADSVPVADVVEKKG